MTAPTPTLTLDVDLTNPGQFLACCGLLELANRLEPEAVGWFEGACFCLTLKGPKGPGLLDALRHCKCAPKNLAKNKEGDQEAKSPPMVLGAPFDLVLDWWEDDTAVRAGLKTWAGGQTVLGFIEGMRPHLAPYSKDCRGLFAAIPLKKPKPFYFDSRISRLTSLDLGFSADGFTTAFSPAVELLTLVGMQRFRPATVVERERYAFATWGEPLPAAIAAAVVPGLIPTLVARRYEFPLVVRTGGKYKAFGPATLERSSHV